MLSRPRSSMPSGSGTALKPDARRWRMNAWIVAVHGPAPRRTVSPTRTTVVMLPPARTSSCSPVIARSSAPSPEVVQELRELLLLVHQAQCVVGALADEVGRGGEPAAIDDDVGAADVRGLVAGQEQIHSPVP